MKIEAKLLKRFIKKACLINEILTINMDFNEDGLKTSIMDGGNVALTITTLDKDKFEDYNPIGRIYIKSSTALQNYLNTFKGIVTLDKIDEYTLKISDMTREGYVILGSDKIVENIWEKDPPEIETKSIFTVNKDVLTQSLADSVLSGTPVITFRKEKDMFSLEVGDKGTSDYFITKIQVEDEAIAFTKLGYKVASLIKVLDNDVEISLGDNVPVIFKEESDGINFYCMIAPRVDL